MAINAQNRISHETGSEVSPFTLPPFLNAGLQLPHERHNIAEKNKADFFTWPHVGVIIKVPLPGIIYLINQSAISSLIEENSSGDSSAIIL